MTKDRDMEWRLVANKGRESCRWQTADGSGWIALTLGAQGDITKVVVAASDGRSEVVEGYEQGLNLARRWRNEWKPTETPRSSTSGPWLPPLPGRGPEMYGEDATPPSYPPESLPQRSTVPPPEGTRSSSPSLSPSSGPHRSRGGENSPLSPVKSGDVGSRTSQSLPPARPVTGSAPTIDREDRTGGIDGRERSWPPRTGTPVTSGRSSNRLPTEVSSDGDADPHTKPGIDPSRSPTTFPKR